MSKLEETEKSISKTDTLGLRGMKNEIIEEGDVVFVSSGKFDFQAVTMKSGAILDTKRGHFYHNKMIGQPWGSQIWSSGFEKQVVRKKRKKGEQRHGFIMLLRPTPELWTKALAHRTQILYFTDIALVLLNLELRPGSIVLESGTGSGSLSTSLARTISPHGHLHTYEFNKMRVEKAREDFKFLGVDHLVTVGYRDVCEEGFPAELPIIHDFEGHPKPTTADAVFLDLPTPWRALASAKTLLRSCGMVCSFSPCIEQVQRTVKEARELGFINFQTVEVKARDFCITYDQNNKQPFLGDNLEPPKSPDLGDVMPKELPFISHFKAMFGHTAWLTFFRKSL